MDSCCHIVFVQMLHGHSRSDLDMYEYVYDIYVDDWVPLILNGKAADHQNLPYDV